MPSEIKDFKIVYRSGEVQFVKAMGYREAGSLTRFVATGESVLAVPTKDVLSISLPGVEERYMPPREV
jgi:hypothetical protein